jgi:hypothetical protein
MVLSGICGPKWDEVIKLHKELQYLYSSPSIIRMMKSIRLRLAEEVAYMREEKNAYRISVRKAKRKRQLGKQKCRRVDSSKMDRMG